MQGLHPPEPSFLPTVADSSQQKEKRSELAQSVDESDSREVLDHMVRLEFDVTEDQQAATNIFSFYGHY